MSPSVDTNDLLKIVKEFTEGSSTHRSKTNKYAPRKFRDETCMFYIRNAKIKAGLNKIPTYLIYFHYVEYMKRNKKPRSTKLKFFRTFGRFFELVRTKSQRYYLLDDSYDFSDNYIALAKRYDLNYETKTKNPKRERPVSGTKSELQSS